MAIKKIPGKGLEVELDDFVKLRAFQTGGEFWGHENQSVIREHLEQFLPRMEVQSDGKSVLAQMFVNGKEVTSTSKPASRGVPRNEKKKLEKAVSRLKEKAADENADQTTRSIIEAFRLPDPSKDTELYRVYGSRFAPKLLVLWGCEKEPGTSIVPDEVSAKIKEESGGSKFLRNTPWLLLVLLLCILGYFAFQQGVFETSGANSNDLVANTSENEKGNSEGGNELAGTNPEDEANQTPGDSTNGSDSPNDGSPRTKGDTSEDRGATVDGSGPDGEDDSTAESSRGNPSTETKNEPALADGSGPDGEDDSTAESSRGNPSTETKNEPALADGSGPDGEDDSTAESSGGNPSTETKNETALADGTPVERENLQNDELTVEESDPDATAPNATTKRPAEINLVDLAKVTRSAVVLIVLSDSSGKVKGSGSGFLISPDGMIVTNHHVLKGSAGALVKLSNRSVFEVDEIIASDKERDLAVFKIDTKGETLPFLSLQEGPGAEIGENIAVIGSPLGLEGTFTVGIVSSTRQRGDVDFLQITAPISPGSSGSPVVNYAGNVVGVAVGAIEEGQSLNFAASVSELRELLANKSVDSDLLSGSEVPLNEKEPETIPKGAENGIGVISIPPPAKKEDPLTVGMDKDLPTLPPSPDLVTVDPDSGSSIVEAPNSGRSDNDTSTPEPENSSTSKPSFRIAQVGKNELPNGKVEVTLELRNSEGAPAVLDDIQWKLNDASTNDAKVNGSRFTKTIDPGAHSLSVSAVTKSGEQININATMNIEVEVRSAVEVRQVEHQ